MKSPEGWTGSEFHWEQYLESTNSVAAPESDFSVLELATEIGFQSGQRLEAVNPLKPHQICAATISQTAQHLLWVHLDSEDCSYPNHIVATSSMDIFPVGWSGSNSYNFKAPKNYLGTSRSSSRIKEETSQPQESSQKSSWCPKIYFNHKCFTGPYLSKGKLAQLPKTVGPGPVKMVLKSVLSLIISAAYKSRQVLKELQCEGEQPPDVHVEELRAKLKTAVYRANVGIITSADKIPEYCQEVCLKLQGCPNLFGPELYTEQCPVGCNTLSKSKFSNYWNKKRGNPDLNGSKKRGRKKLNDKEPKEENGEVIRENDEQESEEFESPSRPESANGDTSKRPYKKKLFPQFEMRTRGAKLPNFALQMANWTWGKDMYMPVKKTKRLNSADSQKWDDKPTKRRGRPPIRQTASHVVQKCYPLMEGNPLLWSMHDVHRYLKQTPDCGALAQRLLSEAIDGHAFMLLNLPTVQDNLGLELGSAIKLCQHVERVKYTYFSEYFSAAYNAE